MAVTLALADFDYPTRSASGYLLRYIVPRTEPVQLFSVMDRRAPFELVAPRSDLIMGVGHGDVDAFTGQNEAVLLEVGKYDPREVEGKVVWLLSCQTGVELGPDVINNGALAFFGFTDDFIWVMDEDYASRPWADDMAAPCLMPVINSMNAVLDGRICGEAYETLIESYIRSAELEEDELIDSCIEFNRSNAILLGDASSRVRARPKLAFPFSALPPPPLPPFGLKT